MAEAPIENETGVSEFEAAVERIESMAKADSDKKAELESSESVFEETFPGDQVSELPVNTPEPKIDRPTDPLPTDPDDIEVQEGSSEIESEQLDIVSVDQKSQNDLSRQEASKEPPSTSEQSLTEPGLSEDTKPNSKKNLGWMSPDFNPVIHGRLIPILSIAGFLILVIAVIGIGLYAFNIKNRVDELQATVLLLQDQPQAAEIQKEIPANTNSGLAITNNKLADLSEHIKLLDDAFVQMKQQIISKPKPEQLRLLPVEPQELNPPGPSTEDPSRLKDRKIQSKVEPPTAVPSTTKSTQPVDLKQLAEMGDSKDNPSQPKEQKSERKTKSPSEWSVEKNSVPAKVSQSQNWFVNLVSVRGERMANKLQREFKSKGVAVEKQVLKVGGKKMYRLQVTGFKSKRKAEDFGGDAIKQLGLKDYWVNRKK